MWQRLRPCTSALVTRARTATDIINAPLPAFLAGERSWAAGGAALATVALLSGTPPAVAGITFTEKPTVKSVRLCQLVH